MHERVDRDGYSVCEISEQWAEYTKICQMWCNALQPATLRKVTLLHGCFSRFLNCAHDTKFRNAPQISN